MINDHPNPEELEGAMKKALYKGDPNDFYRILGGRLDNPEIPFYHTLVAYMHEGEVALENDDSAGYQAALDKWMEAVKYHFENGGAYSLDMTNF